jgi:hypothetical protein
MGADALARPSLAGVRTPSRLSTSSSTTQKNGASVASQPLDKRGWRPSLDLRRFMQISGQMRGIAELETPIALPRR